MILQIITSVLLVIAIAAFFNLTPEQISDDLMALLAPHDTMRNRTKNLRGGKGRHKLYEHLVTIRDALAATGKRRQFSMVVCASAALMAAGMIVSVLIENLFLLPVLAAAFALIPFFYITNTLSYYDKHTKTELETALSIITTSYERCDDIVQAVRENTNYIKPPLRAVFLSFEGEATAVTSNIKRALYSLRGKVDNDIFREWVDTLILCQDDRTLKDTLHSVVQKLADVRIVNSELGTMLSGARNEYWMMAALVVGNIPLLYLLNKDWLYALLHSTAGKAVCGLCGLTILVTALFMKKYTRPVEYKR